MNFKGFYNPTQNWFKLPNEWTNFTAVMKTWAEQKVVEYVLRHTWGYSEYGQLKKISLDEFEHGRKKADSERMDDGIGLHRQAIIAGLKQAVEDGFLIVEVDDLDKGRIKKYYGLRMKAGEQEDDNHTPGVRSSHLGGMINLHRSEKDTLERHYKKETVSVKNGILKRLRDLNQPVEQTKHVANIILDQLGDRHSEKFYQLVAAKIPEQTIHLALSEIKVDGARNPARVFTHRMQKYAVGIALG